MLRELCIARAGWRSFVILMVKLSNLCSDSFETVKMVLPYKRNRKDKKVYPSYLTYMVI